MGGLPRSLGRRHLCLQRGGAMEARPERPMCLSWVSAERMFGCRAVAKHHCIGGFQLGQFWHRQDP